MPARRCLPISKSASHRTRNEALHLSSPITNEHTTTKPDYCGNEAIDRRPSRTYRAFGLVLLDDSGQSMIEPSHIAQRELSPYANQVPQRLANFFTISGHSIGLLISNLTKMYKYRPLAHLGRRSRGAFSSSSRFHHCLRAFLSQYAIVNPRSSKATSTNCNCPGTHHRGKCTVDRGPLCLASSAITHT